MTATTILTKRLEAFASASRLHGLTRRDAVLALDACRYDLPPDDVREIEAILGVAG